VTAREFSLLLGLGAIWGASFLFIKVGGAEIQPFMLVELRLSIAAVILLLIVSRRPGVLSTLRQHLPSVTVLGILNCALPYTLLTWGEHYVSTGLAAIINATSPLWAALLGVVWSWADTLSPSRLFGVLLGLGGVVLVVSGDLGGGDTIGMQPFGLAAVIGMAISYAVASIFARKRLRGITPMVPATGQLVTGAIVLLPLALFQIPQAMPSLAASASVLTLSVVGTALASLIYYWLIGRVGATKTLLVTYLLPGFALIYGAILLHEQITVTAILGLALVLLGIAVTTGTLRLPAAMRRAPATKRPGSG
jgi:drug/metabolite transporter (DMT)-like permease